MGGLYAAVFERARYDLVVDYAQPAVPPIAPHDADWAQSLLKPAAGTGG